MSKDKSRDISSCEVRLSAGSRSSPLAMRQTEIVCEMLRNAFVGVSIDIVPISTKGDKITDRPLTDLGDTGVFTKELEVALLGGRIDFAVHSMKDLPTKLPGGLVVGCVVARATSNDALAARDGLTLDTLPEGAGVGTSSIRRKAQLLAYRPDLNIVPLRGNVDTRLKHVENGDVDAAVLACAGLERLGRCDAIAQVIPHEIMLPAPAQGALAVECRRDDPRLPDMLQAIADPSTTAEVNAERALLEGLGGGCRLPLGALARVNGNTLQLMGCVSGLGDTRVLRLELAGPVAQAEQLGREMAEELLKDGAEQVLGAFRPAAGTGSSQSPLAGVTVVVTRARGQAGELIDLLEARGASVVGFPTIEIVREDNEPPTRNFGVYDWLILTSANAVTMLAGALARMGYGPDRFARARIAAIGPGTASIAYQHGLRIDLVPGSHTAQGLCEAVIAEDRDIAGKRFLLPRSDIARALLVDALREQGARVDEWVLYKTVMPDVPEDTIEGLLESEPDVVTFTSPSTVNNFCRILGPQRLLRLKQRARFAAIGPVTRAGAETHGLSVTIEPENHTVAGVVEAITAVLGNK